MDQYPSMTSRGVKPLAEFRINGKYILGVYQGSLSEFDLLLKYRQLENGEWTRIRTPKHIHWAVDILIKQYCENNTTDKFLDFLIDLWDNNISPIRSGKERKGKERKGMNY